jgi:hypothetical protein
VAKAAIVSQVGQVYFGDWVIFTSALTLKDAAQAALWLRKAAEQGRPEAKFMLAFDYERGKGVSKDDAQSNIWYRKAADQGYPAAMTFGLQASIDHMTELKDPLGDPRRSHKSLPTWETNTFRT